MEACRRASALAAMPSITPNILQSPLMIRQRIVIIFGGGGNAMFVRSFEGRKNSGPDRILYPFQVLFKMVDNAQSSGRAAEQFQKRRLPSSLPLPLSPSHGCQMAKFDPFLSLDCARVEGLGGAIQGKEGIKFCSAA